MTKCKFFTFIFKALIIFFTYICSSNAKTFDIIKSDANHVIIESSKFGPTNKNFNKYKSLAVDHCNKNIKKTYIFIKDQKPSYPDVSYHYDIYGKSPINHRDNLDRPNALLRFFCARDKKEALELYKGYNLNDKDYISDFIQDYHKVGSTYVINATTGDLRVSLSDAVRNMPLKILDLSSSKNQIHTFSNSNLISKNIKIKKKPSLKFTKHPRLLKASSDYIIFRSNKNGLSKKLLESLKKPARDHCSLYNKKTFIIYKDSKPRRSDLKYFYDTEQNYIDPTVQLWDSNEPKVRFFCANSKNQAVSLFDTTKKKLNFIPDLYADTWLNEHNNPVQNQIPKKVRVSESFAMSIGENGSKIIGLNKTKNKEIVKKKNITKQKKITKLNDKRTNDRELTTKDNKAPQIFTNKIIESNNPNYTIKGRVIDNSNTVYLELDNEFITVPKNGRFKIKRFSPVDETINLIAYDKWGNKSSFDIEFKINLQASSNADVLEDLDPNLIKSSQNTNAVAIVIGIEKYKNIPLAQYANRDAKFFYQYAKNSFGIKSENIKLLVDQDAGLVDMLSMLSIWLPNKINKGETDLVIFYSGHGLASSDGKDLFFLPHDGNTDLLSKTALSRTEFFEQINELGPRKVTVFLDTCYSGLTRNKETLLASARPIRIQVKNELNVPENFTIFSASQLNEISSGIESVKHGVFSYYLMKGLEGKADLDQDNEVTNDELMNYLNNNINREAAKIGRVQNPSFFGKTNETLINYN